MIIDDKKLEDTLDSLMLECDVPYEELNFDFSLAKKLVVDGTAELVENTMNSSSLSDEDKIFSLAASIAYLNLENFYLRVQRDEAAKNKR